MTTTTTKKDKKPPVKYKWIVPSDSDMGNCIQYREHPKRPWKVGRANRPERFYSLVFWRPEFYDNNGEKKKATSHRESLGWERDHPEDAPLTIQKCKKIYEELMLNYKDPSKPHSYKAMCSAEMSAKAQELQEERDRKRWTIPAIFEDETLYMNELKDKAIGTQKSEKSMMETHIKPFFKDIPIDEITKSTIAKFEDEIKLKKIIPQSERKQKKQKTQEDSSSFIPKHIKDMVITTEDLSLSTVKKCVGLVRQIWNFAVECTEIPLTGEFPIYKARRKRTKGNDEERKKVIDNKRVQYFKEEQAKELLERLEKYPDVYDMTILGIYAGLRSSEIRFMEWQYVDFSANPPTITIPDRKNDKTGLIFIIEPILSMMRRRYKNRKNDTYVFHTKDGEVVKQIPNAFFKVIKEMGLNEGIRDRRLRYCFHTTRHTFGSWHVQRGTDLYTLKDLMGHDDISQTQVYAKHDPEGLYKAAQNIQKK